MPRDPHHTRRRRAVRPVILFTDAGGVRAAMVDMAERLAAMGYVAFLPEMYYRDGPYEPFDMETVFTDPAERGNDCSA